MNIALRSLLALTLVVTLGACSNNRGSTTVGPMGGSVTLDWGTVTVPEGALSKETALSASLRNPRDMKKNFSFSVGLDAQLASGKPLRIAVKLGSQVPSPSKDELILAYAKEEHLLQTYVKDGELIITLPEPSRVFVEYKKAENFAFDVYLDRSEYGCQHKNTARDAQIVSSDPKQVSTCWYNNDFLAVYSHANVMWTVEASSEIWKESSSLEPLRTLERMVYNAPNFRDYVMPGTTKWTEATSQPQSITLSFGLNGLRIYALYGALNLFTQTVSAYVADDAWIGKIALSSPQLAQCLVRVTKVPASDWAAFVGGLPLAIVSNCGQQLGELLMEAGVLTLMTPAEFVQAFTAYMQPEQVMTKAFLEDVGAPIGQMVNLAPQPIRLTTGCPTADEFASKLSKLTGNSYRVDIQTTVCDSGWVMSEVLQGTQVVTEVMQAVNGQWAVPSRETICTQAPDKFKLAAGC